MADDLDEALAALEKDQLASHRVYRRATLVSMGSFLLLASINALFVVLGGHDRWFWRDLTAIGGLTGLGMTGYLGAVTAYRVVVLRDAELLDALRKQASMARSFEGMRPLMAAIEDARTKGVPLVIQPFEPYGLMPGGGDDQTVHWMPYLAWNSRSRS